MEEVEGRTFTLCGVQGCCPTVTVSESGATFTDDHGGVVRLTAVEWEELRNRVIDGEI